MVQNENGRLEDRAAIDSIASSQVTIREGVTTGRANSAQPVVPEPGCRK
ncbi:MAG: hypothetical protein MRJ92_09820 [Nitrospira sp.]|nr:hypothetical protein [Nitrospira sp.]